MSLEKLEQIINEMENIGEDFKRYKEIYNELSELQNKIAGSVEDLKDNKDSLETLNNDITSSIENLRTKVEELNLLLPQKMLEIMTSNKDIQIDIKNKHEEIIKFFNNKTEELNDTMLKLNDMISDNYKNISKKVEENLQLYVITQKKQANQLLFLTIAIAVLFALGIIQFVMFFIQK